MINPKHPLVKLANVIDWEEIERSFGAHFQATTGRPVLSPRLVAGLLYLQHAYDCSYEAILNTWIENLKTDGRLGRNPLKGAIGDALHAVLCGVGHNIRLLLKKLALLFAHIWWRMLSALSGQYRTLATAR